MSRYDYRENTDKSVASDTFLSRVFGLHSIYSQLQDNYQFYDPEAENHSDVAVEGLLMHSENSAGSGDREVLRADKNLLDLDLDLDLSSDSEALPMPAVGGIESSSAFARHYEPIDNRNTSTNRHGNDESLHLNVDQEESLINDDDTASLYTKPPKRSLKFELPKPPRLFSKKLKNQDMEAGLPLFLVNENIQHRKPQQTQPSVSVQTQYQRLKFRNRLVIPAKERALYLWANIVNMDEFLIDLYYYYRGKGFANIVMGRAVDILILVFILTFTTFLKWGIDYDYFFNEWTSNSDVNLTLRDLIIPNYFSTRVPLSIKFFLLGFACYIVLRLVQLYFDYKYKLAELQSFYRHLLDISDDLELMTISWSTIVERLMKLKNYNSLTSSNPNLPPHYVNDLNSKVRLNAHDIANRIMRKENYMIALINKEVLDLLIPSPAIFNSVISRHSVLTRTLEWNLKLCIDNFVFNENGHINQNILKESSRNQLSQELSSRFKMAAIINLILCPFIVFYFVLLNFFRYFNEYKNNPSSLIGLRQYTPWAEWKLREFNELPHFFIKRLHLSIGPANTYINQFPGGFLINNLMSLANFVSGAFLAVLVLMALLFEDEEHNFWSFEITESRSTLFYISIFGTLWALTSGSLNTSTVTNSAENLNTQGVSFFYDPEASLRYVSQFTHYLPSSWNGRLHTLEVKKEFCELYSLKIIIIFNEILSVILTPFILWFKISNRSSAIIDFFREYSIHVDGLGHVCYFAMFNFEEKDKNMMFDMNKKKPKKKTKLKREEKPKLKHSDTEESSDEQSDPGLGEFYQDDKMIKSYMYFLESYGTQVKGDLRNKPKGTKQYGTESFTNGGVQRSEPSYPMDSVYESAYDLRNVLVEDSTPKSKGKKGVLGMINQFSKQGTTR
ncbi:CIC11C00000002613 [Sungouiella intermedia]|uniref:Autophagy-related protein 9 n=1 Tax=Sungouiella intermedia TaxID=45354 RepID=A0A1L0BNR8_9ASCO|nr:CIC11C00000002613 [[Candida] intermedia]